MWKMLYEDITNKKLDDYLNFIVSNINDELLYYSDWFKMSREDYNYNILQLYLQDFFEDIVYMLQQWDLDYLFSKFDKKCWK